MNSVKYQPSRHIMDFHLAGFANCDGIDVIEELKLGQNVQLVREEGNPHDPDAVAVFYQNTKIGYVLVQYNSLFSTLLYYGHGAILESRIQMVNLETHPERQFRVVVKVSDARVGESK